MSKMTIARAALLLPLCFQQCEVFCIACLHTCARHSGFLCMQIYLHALLQIYSLDCCRSIQCDTCTAAVMQHYLPRHGWSNCNMWNLHPYKIEISTAFRISVQLQALDWLGKCIALPLCCHKKLFDSCVVKSLQQTQLNHTRQSTLCLAC